MEYEWNSFGNARFDPQVVGEALAKLEDDNGGILIPEDVVAAARSAKSPLHPLFEWDDSKAAYQWRVHSARVLISQVAVRVEKVNDGEPVRAFVTVNEEGIGRHYESIHNAMQDPEKVMQIIDRAYRELQSWRRRYKRYEEIAEVFHMLDEAMARLDAKREISEMVGAETAKMESDGVKAAMRGTGWKDDWSSEW